MYKIFFVILHYQNVEDTINCIESINKLKKNSEIEVNCLVIDNKSPNNSGDVLKEKYKNKKNINVMLLDNNYGFSKANNIGYKYCKEKMADLILIINNDIVFEDCEFLIKLIKFYKENNNYEIICPDVINLKDMHQNPMKLKPMTIKKAYKNLIYKKIISILLNIPIINIITYNIEKNRENKWLESYYKNNEIKKDIEESFIPIGAFLIYTKKWILNEDIAFPSDTFMYLEEDFLGIYILNKKYKIFYLDNLKVRHLEGRSVSSKTYNKYKNFAFKYRNQSIAIKRYIEFLQEIRKEYKYGNKND